MATTINSTALDFENIKNNLKVSLQQSGQFDDYNFEGSGVNTILDVLAYNTHYNALIANFALNESYLGTAQLRSSLVSLSEGIGYIPDSRTSARAVIQIQVNLSGVIDRPSTIGLAAGARFDAVIDEVTYTFQTLESLTAMDDGSGNYRFQTVGGSYDITIYEGVPITKTFLVGPYDDTTAYIIPDRNMDIDTAVVRVYDSPTSEFYTTYTNLLRATTINEQSTLYVLKEAPNEFFELTFGNGTTLGKGPQAGNKIVVDYIRTTGPEGNGADVFIPNAQLDVGGSGYDMVVTTVSNSVAGSYKESIESIRKNAPFQYAAQNRMVTAADYSSLVLRNFSSLIKDIQAWGGEDNLRPEYGVVFLAILFNDDVAESTVQSIQDQVRDLAQQLSVISFDIRFVDPIITYIQTNVYFQFNPQLTTLSLNTIQDRVSGVIDTYFKDNIGSFGESFRRSNMLTDVDNVSPAVLSSRADIQMQQRIIPTLNANNDFNLRFPVPIASPDDEEYIVRSSAFTYAGQQCIIRNKLGQSKLQIISLEQNIVIVDNLGEYNSANGTVAITAFAPQLVSGGVNYVAISATPANQSAISPLRNDILQHDANNSFTSGVVVSST